MIRRPPRSTRTDHSFPTRRSSDLTNGTVDRRRVARQVVRHQEVRRPLRAAAERVPQLDHAGRFGGRSEEHTSELQSLMRISYAVFCLKKKKSYRIIKEKHNRH